jgi:coenzyme F420-dependent glucose-6-phosphate dehydrogenase
MNVEDPLAMEKIADDLPIERAASRWIVATDPAQALERIRPYVDMGFNHLVFHAPGADQARFMEYFSRSLMPLLKRSFA